MPAKQAHKKNNQQNQKMMIPFLIEKLLSTQEVHNPISFCQHGKNYRKESDHMEENCEGLEVE